MRRPSSVAGRAPAAGRRPRDPRHEQPRRVQQPRPPASEAGRGDPRAGRAPVFRHQRLGRRAARASWPSAARAIRLRRRPRVLHPRRRRCQRARDQDRAPGVAASRRARSSRATARITAPRTWRWRCRATARTQRQVDAAALGVHHVPPPYAYRCPFGSHDADECGTRAAAAVADRIDALGAGRRRRGADGSRTRAPTASSRPTPTGRRCARRPRSAASG